MMFSIHIRIPFASNLGQRPPFLQHIASLAIVNAVRSKSGYEVCKFCMYIYKIILPFCTCQT